MQLNISKSNRTSLKESPDTLDPSSRSDVEFLATEEQIKKVTATELIKLL